MNDTQMRVAAGVWVVLMAILAYTISVWMCAAVVGGAALALINHAAGKR